MPRAHRYFLPHHVWHLTHRCHQGDFLLERLRMGSRVLNLDLCRRGGFARFMTEAVQPSLPAVAFGYLSISTLTLLPAWSTHEGYVVHYRVFQNGAERDSFTYPITRKMGLWVGLLPLVWINLFTHSEEEAFEATAYQFFRDASPTFDKLAAR